MKKWLVLFIVGLYLFVPFSMLELHPAFAWILVILVLVSGCFNTANAVKMQRNPTAETGLSMKAIMILKLFLLPVYAAFFMILLASLGMLLSIWFTIVGVFMLPLTMIFSYFVLLTSSSLAISQIIILGRKRTMSIGQCVIHIILQLFFVTDVIDSIVVYRKERSAAIK